MDARQNKKPTINLDEEHDKISLSSLSQTLVGLQAQCLSFRREPNDKDYLHKFYEDLALEKERLTLVQAVSYLRQKNVKETVASLNNLLSCSRIEIPRRLIC